MHRNVAAGTKARSFDWAEFKAWIGGNTALPAPLSPSAGMEIGAKTRKSPTSGIISSHNLKRNCRFHMPSEEEAKYTRPAIKCEEISAKASS